MTHQKRRPAVFLQQGFQQFQCFYVQIIGRLVEHQHIGGARKQTRQQQAVTLASRQGTHR